MSETTAALLDGAPLRDLGPQRLKDLLEPIRLYQLEVDGLPAEFPPLRSLHQTNLPVAAWPLLGRERELDEIRALVAGNARLVTLTGAGGSGKTRLALQAAAELSDQFADGVFFVGLAPLRETDAVRATVAEAVGLQADDDVVAWLRSRRVLLVLDNLEHLDAVETVVAELLVGEVVVLATSRAPLHLSAERELPVEPLPEEAAVELFVSRAAAAGRRVEADATVAEVCRRLDNLPLALELAAARAKLLSPAALLQRLDAALPLLSGGAHDMPERQQTLRATIEWSHELLDDDATGSVPAACLCSEDRSPSTPPRRLPRPTSIRWQGFSIRAFSSRSVTIASSCSKRSANTLANGSTRQRETREYSLRHARYYLARLEHDEPELWGARRSELIEWSKAEEDNLRAMLDRLASEEVAEAAHAAALLHRYWLAHGAYAEGRERMGVLLSSDRLPDESRARLLCCLADLESRVGDLDAVDVAANGALRLAKSQSEEHAIALFHLGFVAALRGRSEDAVHFGRQVLEEAETLTESRRLWLRGDVAIIFADVGETEEARSLAASPAPSTRGSAIGWPSSTAAHCSPRSTSARTTTRQRVLAFLQRSKPPAASTITRLRRRSSATSDTHSWASNDAARHKPTSRACSTSQPGREPNQASRFSPPSPGSLSPPTLAIHVRQRAYEAQSSACDGPRNMPMHREAKSSSTTSSSPSSRPSAPRHGHRSRRPARR